MTSAPAKTPPSPRPQSIQNHWRLLMSPGIVILGVYAFTLLNAAILFSLGYPLKSWIAFAALAQSACITFAWLHPPHATCPFTRTILITLAGAAILIASHAAADRIYDTSWDGQAYHTQCVRALAQGWNPFKTPINTQSAAPNALNWRLEYFSRGVETIQAVDLVLTSDLEGAKGINISIAIASFFIAAGALRALNAKPLPSLLCALALAANPVVLCQTFTFYVDGQVYSLLLIFTALAAAFVLHPSRPFAPPLLCAIVGLVNAKFTSVIFCAILIAAMLIAHALKCRTRAPADPQNQPPPAPPPRLLRPNATTHWALLLSIGFLLSIVLVGYNPYVTNTLLHQHPFFPLAGNGNMDFAYREYAPWGVTPPNKIDFQIGQRPAGFDDVNPLQRLAISLFSITDNHMINNAFAPARLKFPLSLHDNQTQIFSLTGPDCRLAGLGPFYSATLVSSTLLLIAGIYLKWPSRAWAAFAFLALLASAVWHPESWWARYSPQFWILPILIVAWALQSAKTPGKIIATAILLITFADVAYTAYACFPAQAADSAAISNEISTLRAQSLHHPLLVSARFDTTIPRLQDAGVICTQAVLPPSAQTYPALHAQVINAPR